MPSKVNAPKYNSSADKNKINLKFYQKQIKQKVPDILVNWHY